MYSFITVMIHLSNTLLNYTLIYPHKSLPHKLSLLLNLPELLHYQYQARSIKWHMILSAEISKIKIWMRSKMIQFEKEEGGDYKTTCN